MRNAECAAALTQAGYGYARVMTARSSLSLAEWTVLGVLSQEPLHGFAVAQLTARGGDLGRIWQIPKPVIYRAIGRLHAAGMITATGMEPGLGPQRTIYTATAAGREEVDRWLDAPVRHIRDIRPQLLLKLALIDRAGAEPAGLIRQQRAVLEPIARAIETGLPAQEGFDATLLAWRKVTAAAALTFLDAIALPQSLPAADSASQRDLVPARQP
jgi:DNA-binding PadR family transcriptional regulator